ncbi:lipase family protein [Nocardia sp. CDC159]|uniref:Lipase family protein n=1 Tax=Nocardia pulmonis TaxID=2951408 RepID=A0A9X2ECM6_9NOCA|nr:MULTISPECIES: lipase family protein [Nocardia]MCM6778292.1 lipase family protein [Nocardia pulmonis]MCM6791181.1 lipase family protein [Nocardia sp. CDC159]
MAHHKMLGGLVVVLSALAVGFLPAIRMAHADPSAFGDVAVVPVSATPGELLRAEPITAVLDPVTRAPLDVRAWRMLYVSTDSRGRRVPVSGTLVLPNAPWPGPGARPLVDFGSSAQGLGRECATSINLQNGIAYETPVLAPFVARGWAVAITDWIGLGAPGEHTYVNRNDMTTTFVDAARAALRVPGTDLAANAPVGFVGSSMGGNAVAGAAERPDYWAGLNVVGGVAAQPITDVLATFDRFQMYDLLGYDTVYQIDGFIAAHPESAAALRGIFNDRGRQILDEARQQCQAESYLRYVSVPSGSVTADGRPLKEYLHQEPLASLFAAQNLGTAPPSFPTEIWQSAADDAIPAQQGRDLAASWCARGGTVAYQEVPGPQVLPGALVAHALSTVAGWDAGIGYLADRFAGRPAPSTCGG